MRKVLLDANILIAALDETGNTKDKQKTQATQLLNTLLSSEEVKLIITPLIRYEVLRGVEWDDAERYARLKDSLDKLVELDVNREVSELASNLFRYDRSINIASQRNIEKRKFDVFHLASAKCHHLEIASQDSDIASLESLYNGYEKLAAT